MLQNRKMRSIIAIVSFLMVAASFAISANAVGGNEGKSDPSVMAKEQDGSTSKKAFMQHHEWMFDQNDTNKDGYLNTDEMRNLHKMVKKMHERFEQK